MADNETSPAAKKSTSRKRAAATAAPESPAGQTGEVTPAKKATRTRKKAADTPPAPDAAPAADAVPAVKKTTRARKAAAPAQQADAPQAPAGAQSAAETAPKTPARKRSTKKAAAPAGTEGGQAAPAPSIAESAPPASEPAAAAPARKRATKKAAQPVAEGGESAPDSPAQVQAPAKRTRRASKASAAPADAPAAAQAGGAAPAASPSEAHSPAFQAEPQPVKAERGPARLATTALLFQPPVPTAVPERPAKAAGKPTGKAASKATKTAKAPAATSAGPEAEPAPLAESAADAPAQPVTGDSGPGPDAGEQGGEDASRRRRRGGRGRRGKGGKSEESTAVAEEHTPAPQGPEPAPEQQPSEDADSGATRRRRRRRGGRGEDGEEIQVVSEVTALKGSTRLEAKRQRRREGRDAGRRRTVITEAEFLARRESVERSMVVREIEGRTQIAVLEDGVLVEHYVSRRTQVSMVGNVYLGRVQNVLPSMEAAFVDVGKGRNAVLYAGEVNWDAAGLDGGQPRRIEQALTTGDSILVQVTKDPIGHKGARLTSQITLAGRYLVYVPGGGMTGISRKLPEPERNRLKKLLKQIVPEGGGVIVRTAAEGASEDELRADIERLTRQWERIESKSKSGHAPVLLQGEPELALRVVRDIFNEDFHELIVSGDEAWETISQYIADIAPDLQPKLTKWTGEQDVFAAGRVDEQLAKGMDRKVWLPSGGSLVIDRTEAMTVIDVNTGKFTGAGGTLEETVTKNNLEAAEEIVRQLRLRDIGGIIVIDFIDMVLESNRDLVLRRLVECLSRDRTRHQVAEVTSLGLVQMTRKRVGQGLVEAFSETCEACGGRGFILHDEPVERAGAGDAPQSARRKKAPKPPAPAVVVPVLPEASSKQREEVKATLATIAAAAAHHHDEDKPADTKAGGGRRGNRRSARPAVEIEVVGDTDPAAEIDVMALIRAEKQAHPVDAAPAPAPVVVPEPAEPAAAHEVPATASDALAQLAAGIPAAEDGQEPGTPAPGKRRHRRAQG